MSLPEKYQAQVSSGVEEDDFFYKKGDKVVSLAYESEGYCTVERAGVRYSITCIMPDGKEFKKIDTDVPLSPQIDRVVAIPKEGEYIYTKCAEGHFTWVPTSIMKLDQKNFGGLAIRPN